jgi:sec-independent protein translocase protein TatB
VLDIGFSELMVVGVVALVVIGPERLPKVARTAGHLMGRMQRYVADVKADINREVEMSELKDLKKTMDDAASTMNDAMHAHVGELTEEVRKAEQEFGRLSNPMMHFGLAGGAGSASTASSELSGDRSEGAGAQLNLELAQGGETTVTGRESRAPSSGTEG